MANREVTITRIFNAPRELVFKTWLDPRHVAQWWGPKGYYNPVCTVDPRPGGAIYIEMTSPDGFPSPTKGIFHEIVEPERLVITYTAIEDEHGNPKLETLNTVTFAELGSRQTHLTLHVVVVKATPELDPALAGMEEGWNQSLDKLVEDLAQTIV